MSGQARPLLWSLLIAVPALSGCIGDEDPVVDAGLPTETDGLTAPDGRDLKTDLLATDVIDAPNWVLGHWFGYHVLFGPEDDTGFHYDSAVVEERGGKWFLASAEPNVAKYEAIIDLPFLGEFNKNDLSTTAFGQTWNIFKFPLSDGLTWTQTMTLGDFESQETATVDIAFTATYDKAISTQDGDRPGFEIEATTKDGIPFLKYDYVPAVGWFAHMYIYDPTAEDPTEEWDFHLMTMGSGDDWTGTYYVDTADQLLAHSRDMWVDAENPAASQVPQNSPYAPFTVAEGQSELYGFIWSYAFAGAHETFVVDPAGNRHQSEALAPGMVCSGCEGETGVEVSIPDPAAGEWKAITAGAGAAAGGGAMLWQIAQVVGTYPA